MRKFQDTLEENLPRMIDAVMRPVEGKPDVSDVWVLALYEDGAQTAGAVYKVGDAFIALSHMPKQMEGFGDGMAVFRELGAAWGSMTDPVKEAEIPHSMLLHYAIADDELDSQMSYETLPRRNDESLSRYAMRWSEEFQG